MDTTRYEIYLGALLHDIGKFWQRGDLAYWETGCKLTQNSQNIKDYICPERDKKLTHQHVIWTHDFFNLPIVEAKLKELGLIKKSVNDDATNAKGTNATDNLIGFAIYHHRPNTYCQKIVQLADCWSSGMDREPKTEQYISENETKNFKKIALESVWEHLLISGKSKEKNEYGFELNPLNINNVFPEKFDKLKLDYQTYWNNFLQEFEKVKTDDLVAFTETLTFLLKRFTWCITSSAHPNDIPNVSLFDHLKSTAAIAQSLYDYFDYTQHKNYNVETKKIELSDNDLPLLLFCGDISGIQNYIYNITATKAAMSLKGRSFYLQLLTDSIIQRIIDDCQVTIGHVVYASGGKFYMILPNIPDVIKSLTKIENEITKNLYSQNHGELYVCMDWIPFVYQKDYQIKYGYKEVKTGSLGKLWSDLLEKTGEKKFRKYQNDLLNRFDDFFGKDKSGFGESGIADIKNTCAVTGEIGTMKLVDKNEKDEKKKVYVLPIVKDQIKLGKILKTADYFITFREPTGKSNLRALSYNPLNLNIHNHLFNKTELTMDEAEFRFISSADVARVKLINKTDFLKINELKGNKSSYGFTFYGGNKQAMRNAFEEKTFHELAGLDEHETNKGKGLHKLGVLRMDIDNLGAVFKDGIENKTFAAYSTLSSQLDLFFCGYLNTIRNNPNFEDHLNILYSGGDDIFAVGRWDKIIEFAEIIQHDFKRFACYRDDIGISAGIAIVGAKFPISKAAEMAGDAEHKAKEYKDGMFGIKNAICFLDETISWNGEFMQVKAYKNMLVDFQEQLSAGFRQKLQTFYVVKNRAKYDNRFKGRPDLSYKWNCAYTITRFKDRFDRDSDVWMFLNNLKNELFTNERTYDLVALASRWAELEIRMRNEN